MRDLVFSFRLTDAEREAIDEAAEKCELGPTTWARLVLLGAIHQSPIEDQIELARAEHASLKKA